LPKTKILHGDGNLWWGGSLQKGYEYLTKIKANKNDFVLIINDDTSFDEKFLQIGMEILNKNKKTLLKSWSIDKYSKKKGGGYFYFNEKTFVFQNTVEQKKANCISTRGVFLALEDFMDIGGFVPKKLPHYFSDYEWAIRAYKKGYRILCDDKLFLESDSAETGYSKINCSSLKIFYKEYFSIKNPANPKDTLAFIRLVYTSRFYLYKAYLKTLVKAGIKIFLAFVFFSVGKKEIEFFKLRK
jgi:GT2 family glycosyltransferase